MGSEKWQELMFFSSSSLWVLNIFSFMQVKRIFVCNENGVTNNAVELELCRMWAMFHGS